MLGVIGGTGLYQLEGVAPLREYAVATPFGAPSAPIVEAEAYGRRLFFLARHGRQHQFLPHEVNYRANIYALKTLGVRQILSVSAVGSLREAIAPGHFAIPAQYIDQVKGPRDKTFLGCGLAAHISTAEPVCPDMAAWIARAVQASGHSAHGGVTYVCVDGPRLGTRAESRMMQGFGGDLVGMTHVPEVFLAREAQIAYAALCVVTDYDCWRDDPGEHVSVTAILKRFGDRLGVAKRILADLLEQGPPPLDEAYRCALKEALMVRPDGLDPDRRALLDLLLM
jgi:5'-methylthioadenosine phosphorylase